MHNGTVFKAKENLVHRLASKSIVSILFLCPLLAMTATKPPESLDGSAWLLAELPPESLLEDVTATLAFEDGDVAGTDGCNRFRGSYEFSDGKIRIGKLASTMMACPEPVMRQAGTFTAALERARRATLEDDSLVLHDGEGELLARFDPQLQTVANTRWAVTGHNNGKQAVVSAAQGTSLSLEFDGAGGASGSAGCNRFRASYLVDGKTISFGEAALTRKMCEESVMDQESAFLKALERSSVVRIEADRLELRDDDGALQVTATYLGTHGENSP